MQTNMGLGLNSATQLQFWKPASKREIGVSTVIWNQMRECQHCRRAPLLRPSRCSHIPFRKCSINELNLLYMLSCNHQFFSYKIMDWLGISKHVGVKCIFTHLTLNYTILCIGYTVLRHVNTITLSCIIHTKLILTFLIHTKLICSPSLFVSEFLNLMMLSVLTNLFNAHTHLINQHH